MRLTAASLWSAVLMANAPARDWQGELTKAPGNFAPLRQLKATYEFGWSGLKAGRAEVDPKEGLYKTCRYCDLHTLCRVHERLSALDEEEADEAGE